jgi:hypothetical protein
VRALDATLKAAGEAVSAYGSPGASSLRNVMKKDRLSLRDEILSKMSALEHVDYDASNDGSDGYYSSTHPRTVDGVISANPLSSRSLSSIVVAPSASFASIGVASPRTAGPSSVLAASEATGAYAIAHWRFAQASDLRRRADYLSSAAGKEATGGAAPGDMSLSRKMVITASIWEFHLMRMVGKPASSNNLTGPAMASATAYNPLSSTKYIDYIGGVYEYFASNFGEGMPSGGSLASAAAASASRSTQVFYAYLKHMLEKPETGYCWLARHMLGLAGLPTSYNPLFSEAALALMRAAKRCIPDRKATFMHALFARGPTAGSALGANVPVATSPTNASSPLLSSPGLPSSQSPHAPAAAFTFAATATQCTGYETAKVSAITALRIIESVLASSPAFSMTPLQRFCDFMGVQRSGWSAAGRRDISEMLIACMLGRFDTAIILASDEKEELLLGPSPGAEGVDILSQSEDTIETALADSSVTFPNFFDATKPDDPGTAARRVRTIAVAAASDPLDTTVPDFSAIAQTYADTLGDSLTKPGSSAMINVEDLVVGLMAAWCREYERWCRRLDRAYYVRLHADRMQHEQVIHSLFERQLAPVFEDLETMLTVIEPKQVTEEEAAEFAKQTADDLLMEAIEHAKRVCTHQPTLAVLLTEELKALLIESIGTMAKVNYAAVNLLAQAKEEREAAAVSAQAAAEATLAVNGLRDKIMSKQEALENDLTSAQEEGRRMAEANESLAAELADTKAQLAKARATADTALNHSKGLENQLEQKHTLVRQTSERIAAVSATREDESKAAQDRIAAIDERNKVLHAELQRWKLLAEVNAAPVVKPAKGGNCCGMG